ncbi:MAG: hypothetical protein II541_08415, partial [Prevotella sp.]|nr:hypothetical protein [Prevotella sp.]
LAISNYDNTNGTNRRTLVVCRFKIYRSKVLHLLSPYQHLEVSGEVCMIRIKELSNNYLTP